MSPKWQPVLMMLLVLTGGECTASTQSLRGISTAEPRQDLLPLVNPQSIQYGNDSKVPYDAAEYWSKVLELINLHDGYIDASELQKAFDKANLVRVRNIGQDGYAASLVAQEKWFGSFWYVRLWRPSQMGGQTLDVLGGDFSLLAMPGILDEQKQCLDPIKSSNDLQALGWRRVPYQDALMRSANSGPPPESFGTSTPIKMVKGKGSSITLSYTDPSAQWGMDHPGRACVAGISIEGNK